MTKANKYQIGGDHYSQAGRYQHWDFVEDHGIGYLEGYATKYLVRWDKKGMPVQDLQKSQHIVAKLIELAEAGTRHNRAKKIPTLGNVGLFCSANKVSDEHTAKAIELLFMWKTKEDLEVAFHHIRFVLEAQPSQRIKREYDKGGRKPHTMDNPRGYDPIEEGVTDASKEKSSRGDPSAEALRETSGPGEPESRSNPETSKR